MMETNVIQIVTVLALLGFMWSLHREVSNLHKDVRKEMADFRQEMRTDMAGLRQEIKTDMADLRLEVQEVKGHMSGFRERMAKVEGLLEGVVGPPQETAA